MYETNQKYRLQPQIELHIITLSDIVATKKKPSNFKALGLNAFQTLLVNSTGSSTQNNLFFQFESETEETIFIETSLLPYHSSI